MTDPEDKVRNWREQMDAEKLAHDEVAFRKWRAQGKLTEGGPAFPVHEFSGMTIRDYFAAAALTGIISCFRDHANAETVAGRTTKAFEYADAMLERRTHG